MHNVIELINISKKYKIGSEETLALDNISLSVKQGEFVAIMGPSGSGKSSLMHILGLLDKPTSGTYLLDGEDVSSLSEKKQARVRNEKIGFIFQQFNLLPRSNVIDNILLPTVYSHASIDVSYANTLLDKVGLADKKKNKSNELSGGQVQRVAIARALMLHPSLLLADEPTGNLDTKRSKEIMQIFKEINQQGTTIVLITHESDIASYADRIENIVDGHLIDKQDIS